MFKTSCVIKKLSKGFSFVLCTGYPPPGAFYVSMCTRRNKVHSTGILLLVGMGEEIFPLSNLHVHVHVPFVPFE